MEQSILFVENSLTARDGRQAEIKPFSTNNSETSRHPALTLVAVVGRDGAIGCDGDLLWHLPADLRHFKAITLGGAVVMGRRTWESLPRRPLPGRLNIVVTRNASYEAPGAVVASSLEEALEAAKDSRAFVIGGGQIYAQAMPLASCLELTEVDADAPHADTFFPEVDMQQWRLAAETRPGEADIPDGAPSFRFATYLRR